jgi:hypothetical protein
MKKSKHTEYIGQLTMVAKFHTCGHRIWLDYRQGPPDPVLIFIDDDETSVTCGQEIDTCPTCGEYLPHTIDPNAPFFAQENLQAIPKAQILLILRRLKEEIERETGCLTDEQTLLLVDVCQALGFYLSDANYVLGVQINLVTAPIFLPTSRNQRISTYAPTLP